MTRPILMLCTALSAAMLGLGAGPVISAAAEDPNAVVITIDDHKITAAQFENIVNALPAEYQQAARGPRRREFAMNLAQLQLLADRAVKGGLDMRPDVKAQLEFERLNLLARAMLQNLEDTSSIPDAQVQAYYEAHKAEYESVTARHILITMEGTPVPSTPGKRQLSDAQALAKAKAIRSRILGGEDFAKLAKEESDDTGSGANGGDLGAFKRGMMVPPFETAAFALKPGDISEPVKSQFGYHIIQVQAHSMGSLDEVKSEILAKLKPEAAQQAVDAMTDKAKINLNETFFGAEPTSPAGTAAPARK